MYDARKLKCLAEHYGSIDKALAQVKEYRVAHLDLGLSIEECINGLADDLRANRPVLAPESPEEPLRNAMGILASRHGATDAEQVVLLNDVERLLRHCLTLLEARKEAGA